MRLIDFAEKKAEELMIAHHEDNVILNREMHATFAFIFAALSGVFAYFLKLIDAKTTAVEQPWEWMIPTMVCIIYLFSCGWYLLAYAMMAEKIYHRGNEPKNLLTEEMKSFEIDDVRWAECANLQLRIEHNRARNLVRGSVLNRTRKSVILTPLIFSAVWAVVQVAVAAA